MINDISSIEQMYEKFISPLRSKTKLQYALILGDVNGLNSIFMAKNGFHVTSIDSSEAIMQKLSKCAFEEGVEVLTLVYKDINLFDFGKNHWDIIISNHMVHVSLCYISISMRPFGFYIFEADDTNRFTEKDRSTKEQLQVEIELNSSLEIVHLCEKVIEEKAFVVQGILRKKELKSFY